MKKSEEKLSVLEESLLRALEALDSQIQRSMQRTPAEREEQGVQKWKPIEERVEKLTGLLLDAFGNTIELDSIIILSQTMAKALSMICSDLGVEGLGDVRSRYVEDTLRLLSIEIERTQRLLKRSEISLM